MSIRLEKQPSTDGLGVKRWTYVLNSHVTLHVFERPPSYADTPFLLRVDHADGRTLETILAATKGEAISQAQGLSERDWQNA